MEGDVRPAVRWRASRALRTGAAAVIYAGGPVLGDLLVRHLRLAPDNVMSLPNGFEPADAATLSAAPVRVERNGAPLDLVMSGGISPPIAAQLHRAIGHPLASGTARSRRARYERLHHADAAVVTMDTASAVESRIPAKVYDYLATGVPVIAVCPPGAALLTIPEARRFHHIHHQDSTGLAALLRRAKRDRTVLRPGMPGEGPTRDHGVTTLHSLLRRLAR